GVFALVVAVDRVDTVVGDLIGVLGEVVIHEVDDVDAIVQQVIFDVGAGSNTKVVAIFHFFTDGFVLFAAHALVKLLSRLHAFGAIQDRQCNTIGLAGADGHIIAIGGVEHLLGQVEADVLVAQIVGFETHHAAG